MKIEMELNRIIKNKGAKEVAQAIGVTQVKLKRYELDGVNLQPLIKYLKEDDCICNTCKGKEYRIKSSKDFKDLELACNSCGGNEFSNSFICGCCKTPTVVDIDSSWENEFLYKNKICKDCLDSSSKSAKLAFVWSSDISYLDTLLYVLPKEKQLLIAEYICSICDETEIKDIYEYVDEQKDEYEGYSEEYIEIMAKYLKRDE